MNEGEYYSVTNLPPFAVDQLRPKDVELADCNIPNNKYLQELDLLSEILCDPESEELIFQVYLKFTGYSDIFYIPPTYDIITAIYISVEHNPSLYNLETCKLYSSLRLYDYDTQIEVHTTEYIHEPKIVTIYDEDYTQIVPAYPYFRCDCGNTRIDRYPSSDDDYDEDYEYEEDKEIIYIQGINCSERMKSQLPETLLTCKNSITQDRLNSWIRDANK